MKALLHKLKGSSSLSFYATAGTAALGFLNFLITARLLDASELGQWVVFLTTAGLIDMMRGGLIQNALVKKYAETKDAHYFKASAQLMTALSLLISFCCFVVGFLLHWYYWFFAVLPVLLLVNVPYFQRLWRFMALENFKGYLKIRVLPPFLFLGYLLFAYLAGSKELFIAEAYLLSFAISSLAALGTRVIRKSGISERKIKLGQYRKQLYRYGRFTVLSLLGTNLLKSADTFLISIFLGPAAVAFFAVPQKALETFEIPTRSAAITLFPKLSRLDIKSERQKFKSLFLGFSIRLTLIMLPLVLALILFSETVLTVLGGAEYLESDQILVILAFLGLLLPIDRFIGVALDSLGAPQINSLKVAVMVAANIIGDCIALTLFESLEAVALTSLFMTSCGIIFGAYHLLKKLEMKLRFPSPSSFKMYLSAKETIEIKDVR